MYTHRLRRRASALILTLSALAILSIAAAYTLRRVSPRFQMTSQASAWQEARLAAESGIDVALADVSRNATGMQDGNWQGWQQLDAQGHIVPVLSGTLNLVNSLLSLLGLAGNGGSGGNAVKVSAPIFLDNLQVASPGNRPTNVDVQLWAVYPTPSPYYRWFRLRAMATCARWLPARCHDDLRRLRGAAPAVQLAAGAAAIEEGRRGHAHGGAVVGVPIGYRIARYVEDVRE